MLIFAILESVRARIKICDEKIGKVSVFRDIYVYTYMYTYIHIHRQIYVYVDRCIVDKFK